MVTELYKFITHPKKYIKAEINTIPTQLTLTGILLYAVSQGMAFSLTPSLNNIIFLSITYLLLNGIAMIFSVSFIDFFAQLTNCKAQSKKLFFWMFTPYIFSALFIPVQLLTPIWSGLLSLLIAWVLIGTIISLQLFIISQLYSISSFKSILLYMSPILVILSILLISLFVIGKTIINFISYIF